MAKKVTKAVKLQITAAKATPAPPVGTALGPTGINIGDFVSKFNAATAQMAGDIVPVIVSIYDDRSFDFILKTPPVPQFILKAAKIDKGAGKTGMQKAGSITKAQVREIAEGVQHGHHRHHRQQEGQHIAEAEVVVDVAEQHQHQHESQRKPASGGNDENAALVEDDGSAVDFLAKQPGAKKVF